MPEAPAGALVLDTHVWIWTVEGDRAQLSSAALRQIEGASERGGILISAISVWEVAMLAIKGRISLSRPVDEWVRAALRAPGSSLLALTPEIAIDSTRLPGSPPEDPADRILIASARVTGGSLATRDRAILEYARGAHVRVTSAHPEATA